MKQKVNKPKGPDHKYSLSVNTPLLYLLQQTTGDSTFKIVSYFYDLMVKQRAEIEVTNTKKDNYSKLQQKKSYGYYPGTSAYFIICTTKKDPINNAYYGDNRDHTLWDCNVSL